MRAFVVIMAQVLLTAVGTAAQAPVPVAERVATHLGRTTRVSLFSNHVVVVSIRSESENYVHRATLELDEYMVYLQTLNRAIGEVGDTPVGSDVESRDSVTVLTVYLGPDAPRVFRYSPLSSLNLAVGKIASAMDDLENRALEALPGEYEIRQWQPEIGDCVELRQGGEACVTAISEDGSIVLMRDDIVMTYNVARENRAEVILKIIEPAP
ncbi:MAG: hypothetical protein AB1Z65_13925 [Candidatus Sulfomarinibacteraceae bacterium]